MIPYFSFTQIQLGPITIQVWGLMASLGFLTALFLSLREAKKSGIEEEKIWNIMILALIGAVAGSKFFYALFHFGESDLAVTLFSASGFSSIGGVVLASILVIFYARLGRINIWKLADALTPGLITAIMIVRLGCFLVYDHIGKITNLPWGRLYLDQTIRHPISLYYIISALAVFLIICYLKRKQLKEGVLFLVFAAYYSISVFLIDFLRCDDLMICDRRFWSLTHSQLILLVLLPFLICFLKKISCSVKNI